MSGADFPGAEQDLNSPAWNVCVNCGHTLLDHLAGERCVLRCACQGFVSPEREQVPRVLAGRETAAEHIRNALQLIGEPIEVVRDGHLLVREWEDRIGAVRDRLRWALVELER